MATITYACIKKPIEERIIDAACIYWDVERSYFSSHRPDSTESYRKSIIYYLIKNNTSYSYSMIASKFGFTTHGPVGRLVDNIEAQKNVLRHICNDISEITKLADRLDADFVSTAVKLVNIKLQSIEE